MQTYKQLFFLLIATLFLTSCNTKTVKKSTNLEQFYTNPILGGDYPDPSIVRVGLDYYMTHSSFEYYPGLIVWHSTDMIHWERISAALHTNLGSVWAPDLVYYKNQYYIYFPAGGTNWVVTAPTPEGPWSDPVDLNLPGFIDPGHAVDAEGNRYLFLSKGYAVQLSKDGLSTIGKPQFVYEGWQYPKEWSTECFCLESPKVTVRNGYFYLTVAEGGTAGPATSHMVVSARSKNPFGPYENSPYNPIIHTESRNEKWWSQGHGTLFNDTNEDWWIMYHGYQKGFHTLGRQTLMLPLEWTDNNWFKVPDGIRGEDKIAINTAASVTDNSTLTDNFENSIGLQWQFLKDYDSNRISVIDGKLVFKAKGNSFDESSPLLVNAGDEHYEIITSFEIDEKVTTGLTLYYNEKANVRVEVTTKRFSVYIQKYRKISVPNNLGGHGYLRILNDHNEVSFYYSNNGNYWQRVERSLDATGYNHNVFGEFLSLRAGIFAYGEGAAKFSSFQYNILD